MADFDIRKEDPIGIMQTMQMMAVITNDRYKNVLEEMEKDRVPAATNLSFELCKLSEDQGNYGVAMRIANFQGAEDMVGEVLVASNLKGPNMQDVENAMAGALHSTAFNFSMIAADDNFPISIRNEALLISNSLHMLIGSYYGLDIAEKNSPIISDLTNYGNNLVYLLNSVCKLDKMPCDNFQFFVNREQKKTELGCYALEMEIEISSELTLHCPLMWAFDVWNITTKEEFGFCVANNLRNFCIAIKEHVDNDDEYEYTSETYEKELNTLGVLADFGEKIIETCCEGSEES